MCSCHKTNWFNLFQVWFEDGYVFSKFIPSCIDPTHCDTDPPEPSPPNVVYIKPELGSLKYGDGEIINYKCQNPSRLFQIIDYVHVVSIKEAFSVNINVVDDLPKVYQLTFCKCASTASFLSQVIKLLIKATLSLPPPLASQAFSLLQ